MDSFVPRESVRSGVRRATVSLLGTVLLSCSVWALLCGPDKRNRESRNMSFRKMALRAIVHEFSFHADPQNKICCTKLAI
jgi:hypothetical protein